ncbi:hypothetical protein GWK78_01460 [Candidatus Saccharibacteria bacterium oral taxon 488]|nr:hypothetical protein GWK78_01460 [Candidatus Saccharibacteria bacterium oral taxon 488]
MTGIPKPPEGMPSEGQNNAATRWDTLQENPAGIKEEVQEDPETPAEVTLEPSEPEMYHGPLEKAPLLALGDDLADARIFFSDAVDIAKYAISNGPEAPEEGQPVLLIFGGVCVPVYENSDPEKLEAAWARVMRGHCDQQIKVPDPYSEHPVMAETYPLVIKTLDDIPEKVLAAEAREDEARRNDEDDYDIQRADIIINRQEKYEGLKEKLWDVEIRLAGAAAAQLPPNIYGDRDNPIQAEPFTSEFEARGVMYSSYTFLLAKLMQDHLNNNETATVADIAGEALRILDIRVNTSDPLFNAVTGYLLPDSAWGWDHGQELLGWYNEVRERQSGYRSPLPPEAQ